MDTRYTTFTFHLFSFCTRHTRRVVKIGRSERTIILDASNRSGYDYDDFGMVVDEWLRQVGVIHTLMQNDEAIHVELLADECKIAAAV